MAAAKGNKYAEKWNVEQARELATKALNTVSNETYFVSTIAEKCGIYRELFNYLMIKFNDDHEVFNTLKRMYNKCESTLWEKAAAQSIDKTIAIFALKSLHGLFETSKFETESKVDLNLEGSTMTELLGELSDLKKKNGE